MVLLQVAPLLAVPRLMRLELFSLRNQADSYRALLQQVDGLLHRHGLQELLTEAAATLAYASKEGPAALQVGAGCPMGGGSDCHCRMQQPVAWALRMALNMAPAAAGLRGGAEVW